jgi:hypothetical protein
MTTARRIGKAITIAIFTASRKTLAVESWSARRAREATAFEAASTVRAARKTTVKSWWTQSRATITAATTSPVESGARWSGRTATALTVHFAARAAHMFVNESGHFHEFVFAQLAVAILVEPGKHFGRIRPLTSSGCRWTSASR